MAPVGEIWVTTLVGFFQFNLVSDDFSTPWIDSPKPGSAWKKKKTRHGLWLQLELQKGAFYVLGFGMALVRLKPK